MNQRRFNWVEIIHIYKWMLLECLKSLNVKYGNDEVNIFKKAIISSNFFLGKYSRLQICVKDSAAMYSLIELKNVT